MLLPSFSLSALPQAAPLSFAPFFSIKASLFPTREAGNLPTSARQVNWTKVNFSFNDKFKAVFMGTGPNAITPDQFWKFFGANLASGGAAGATSLAIVYPLDFARTRLGADVGKSVGGSSTREVEARLFQAA